MNKYIIKGGRRLNGRIRVSGAKNAVLPILAAAVLNNKPIILHDCPNLLDIEKMLMILESIGCNVKREKYDLILDPSGINNWIIPDKYVKEIRSSVILLGAMLARMNKAEVTYPGGCEIGQRPIDLHLQGLRQLGVQIDESHGNLECRADILKGTEIHLEYPSVGATENIMLAACRAEGTTIIRNAAKEPEIEDLQNFINALGGKVYGAGSTTVIIEGVKEFSSEVEYTVIPDRIVTGTYLIAGAITGGDILLDNIRLEHIKSIIFKLKETGCDIEQFGNSIRLKSNGRLSCIENTKTLPYPGFPSDMQAPLMALLSASEGTSIITETIFENRYKHVPELVRMGANITLQDRVAIIRGVERLNGSEVWSTDLRGGAALVLAGLCAEGTTIVNNINHIDRGYERLENDFAVLGADIIRA